MKILVQNLFSTMKTVMSKKVFINVKIVFLEKFWQINIYHLRFYIVLWLGFGATPQGSRSQKLKVKFSKSNLIERKICKGFSKVVLGSFVTVGSNYKDGSVMWTSLLWISLMSLSGFNFGISLFIVKILSWEKRWAIN